MINEAVKNEAVKGIKIEIQRTLSHLHFVDDVLLFGNGTLREALNNEKQGDSRFIW